MRSLALSASTSLRSPSTRKPVATRFGARSSPSSRGQQVAGDLLADEPVERLVGVERVDDVIAIAPGVLGEEVVGACRSARRSGRRRASAGPSARRTPATPAADRRRALGPGATGRRRTRRSRSGVGGRPVRSNETPANQVWRSASGDGPQPLRFEPRQDEAIDVVPRPGRVVGLRGASDELGGWIGPEFRPCRDIVAGWLVAATARPRVGAPGVDPALEVGDDADPAASRRAASRRRRPRGSAP